MDYLARVATPAGEILERVFAADSEDALRRDLAAKNFHVFSVRRKAGVMAVLSLGRKKRISSTEFLLFNHEFATLIKAGLPVLQGLEILLERMSNPTFKEALQDIRDQVRNGNALSDAFASHPTLFPPLYSSSLKAGERSGDLEGVVRRYIAYSKVMENVAKKVTQALIYPAILVGLATTVVIILLTKAIPQFADALTSTGKELPWLTRYLIAISSFMTSYLPFEAVGLVGGIIFFLTWKATPRGQAAIDSFKLRVPFLGRIYQKFAISQLTRSLATLLGGGIPLVTAIEISAGSVSNSLVAQRVRDIVQLVREGQPLALSLDRTGLIPSMVIEMVKVGEATGALTEMLVNVADYYDEDIDTSLSRLVAVMEPALLVFMGGVIGVLLLAMYLPIFEMQQVAQ